MESLDIEQCSFYVDVFTSMVGNNLEEILNEKRYDLIQIIVDLTKKCPSIKIYAICEFFENFNSILFKKNYSVEQVMELFKSMFIKLIHNLIFLTKFEENIFEELNKTRTSKLENNEEYNITIDYRNSIKDFLEDFTYNYGFNMIFIDIIFPEFKTIINKIKENEKNLTLWNKLENILYIFSCFAKEIDVKDKSFEIVQILFYTIFEIPKEYSQIIRTITYIMDNCRSIFYNDKDLLFKGFKFLIVSLDNDLTLRYCSKTAKKLLCNNKETMSEKRMDFINLYNNKLKNKVLLSDKYLDLIEGMVEVITYSKDENNIKENELIKKSIVEILRPWVLYLQEAKKLLENNQSLSNEDKRKFCDLLIVIKFSSKSAFEGLNSKNKSIMYEIFCEIWPLLIFILKKMLTKSKIVENIIQLIKIYMRGLKINFIKFIPEYANCIIEGYKLIPISSYLYGLEILIAEFNEEKDEQIKSILNKTFNEICQITLSRYIKNDIDLNTLIEIRYDFFGMLFRVIESSPNILLDSSLFQNIINIALINFDIDQIEDVRNVITFFERILSYEGSSKFKEMRKKDNILYEKYKNIIQNQINNFSFSLCEKILKNFVDSPTEGIIEDITYLIKNYIEYQKPLFIKGMQYHLNNIPNDILTNKEKEEFINLIDNYKIKEKEFNKFIYNFRNRCVSKQVRERGKQ